ncbi:MAG: hypothetical protein HXX13_04340 [Bacteroidetes bacterium]|nr:hypothetical protein [Bacteroidota bacterium]
MKNYILLISLLVTSFLSGFSQKSPTVLTFTGRNNEAYAKLDSIRVLNRTAGGDTIFYYPDTSFFVNFNVGLGENEAAGIGFELFPNYPNPVLDLTTITMYVPSRDKVTFSVTDMLGRKLFSTSKILDEGYQSFQFTPSEGSLLFFSAIYKGVPQTIKIIHAASNSPSNCSLEYIGSYVSGPELKSSEKTSSWSYTAGNHLMYIGYSAGKESGMMDIPYQSSLVTLQFATNIPCPGTPTVSYYNQTYNTIQIFGQCWLKENVNAGVLQYSSVPMQNDGIIQKYCQYDNLDSCTRYGGLYKWDEMMQYSTAEGAQGICPNFWHIPTDDDWKILEGATDSQYRIADNLWEMTGYKGYDVGTNLKATDTWIDWLNGLDAFGFRALPGGYNFLGTFGTPGAEGNWWSSTTSDTDNSYTRRLSYTSEQCDREAFNKAFAFSVRCIKN